MYKANDKYCCDYEKVVFGHGGSKIWESRYEICCVHEKPTHFTGFRMDYRIRLRRAFIDKQKFRKKLKKITLDR